MVFGVGNVVALICIVISLIFAGGRRAKRPTLFGGRFWRSSRCFVGRPGALGELEARHALPAYADPLSARNNAVRGDMGDDALLFACGPGVRDIEDCTLIPPSM